MTSGVIEGATRFLGPFFTDGALVVAGRVLPGIDGVVIDVVFIRDLFPGLCFLTLFFTIGPCVVSDLFGAIFFINSFVLEGAYVVGI